MTTLIIGALYFIFIFSIGGLIIVMNYSNKYMYTTYLNALKAWYNYYKNECNIFGKTIMLIILIIMIPSGLIWTTIYLIGYFLYNIFTLGLKKEQ